MKSKALKIFSLCLALILVFGAVLNASAAKYVNNVVAKNSDYKKFLQPGDLDADKKVNESDVSLLKGLLLTDGIDTYSDVNGDGVTDICDLVLQDDRPTTFIDGAKINLKGKSIYKSDIGSILTTGAEYKITFTKTGDVTVNIVGLGSTVSTTTTNYTFKTPLTISKADVKLEIIGNGTIENLKIARINMDNDTSVN